jgi:hypothetical protein
MLRHLFQKVFSSLLKDPESQKLQGNKNDLAESLATKLRLCAEQGTYANEF